MLGDDEPSEEAVFFEFDIISVILKYDKAYC